MCRIHALTFDVTNFQITSHFQAPLRLPLHYHAECGPVLHPAFDRLDNNVIVASERLLLKIHNFQ
jgi:hypothetical protein